MKGFSSKAAQKYTRFSLLDCTIQYFCSWTSPLCVPTVLSGVEEEKSNTSLSPVRKLDLVKENQEAKVSKNTVSPFCLHTVV